MAAIQRLYPMPEIWKNSCAETLTSDAMDALCALASSKDLPLVRTLDDNELVVDYLESALRFLSRFGDWSDKDRILSFTDRYRATSQTWLSLGASERNRPIATALYAIGKSRLLDLLKLDMDTAIRRALLIVASQKDIDSLSDDIVMTELNNKDDQTRKVLALRCVEAMTQARIRKLLDKYVNQEGEQFYNSVHWLDLGASMARTAAKAVAKFELTKFD